MKTTKNKEFKIGEVFQFGVLHLKTIEDDRPTRCINCALFGNGLCALHYEEFVGPCDKSHRTDKKSIYFKKVTNIK